MYVVLEGTTGTGYNTKKKSELKIFPNPAGDKFRVDFQEDPQRNHTFELISLTGQKVFIRHPVKTPFEVKTNRSLNGVFFAILRDGNRIVGKEKVVLSNEMR
jgi:hypothetical protein